MTQYGARSQQRIKIIRNEGKNQEHTLFCGKDTQDLKVDTLRQIEINSSCLWSIVKHSIHTS